ncbi:MAG: hypothetical protein IKV20_03830 [Clostridia bacterium]|nr:hypothetical protein [Clostridia bacterium]
MKRFLSGMLAVISLLALSLTLVACFHECSFPEEWSYDEEAHFRVCTGEECEITTKRIEHAFDAGIITTAPTQEADGTKTFTCTICGYERTETVLFAGITREEWNSTLDISNFDNFRYTELGVVSYSGIHIDTVTEYAFTKYRAKVNYSVGTTSEEMTYVLPSEVSTLREALVESLQDILKYEDYGYIIAEKLYRANKEIYIESIDASTSDVTVKFKDGRLSEISFTATFTEVSTGIEFTTECNITVGDYGEVVVEQQ